MAKVINPLHSAEARGTINGLTYSQRGGASVVRRHRRPPPREASAAERDRRDIFYDTGQLYRIAENIRQFYRITNPITGEQVIQGPQLIDIFKSQVPENINPFNHWQRASRLIYDRFKITTSPDFFGLPQDDKITWTVSADRGGLREDGFIGRHTTAKILPAELAYHLAQIAISDPDGARRKRNDGADLRFEVFLDQQIKPFRFHQLLTERLGWWFDNDAQEIMVYDERFPNNRRGQFGDKTLSGIQHQLPRNEYLLTGNEGTETSLECRPGNNIQAATYIASARFVAAAADQRLDLISILQNVGDTIFPVIICGMTRGGDLFIRQQGRQIIARTNTADITMFGQETEIVVSAKVMPNQAQEFTMTMYQRERKETISTIIPAGTIPILSENNAAINIGTSGINATANVFDGIVREIMIVRNTPDEEQINPQTWRARDNLNF